MIEYLYPFIKGLITGISIAAIGGPVGILCIRYTLMSGISTGCALGVGAALADSLYGSIAAFSLTIISDFLFRHQYIISLAGSCFLVYLGIKTLYERPQKNITAAYKMSALKSIATSFFITLTNPATILFFTAVAVSIGIELRDYIAAWAMVMGIFVGTTLWFSLLSGAVYLFRHKIDPLLGMINKVFGICLIAFGIVVAAKTLLF